ncbi:Dynamitin-domain-containing protein [Aspergillus candidus]|uniref:Dynamitin-domain-containing protein n=1 Tax=Aspergillus candidus TaxID=41067 RepID=A0A2I2FHE5_ASPCN|nr:Dynamitin-domain-containing protein [Aspergillus candidus]PLB40055.1 Dynamitin-domain-containing protein [Aspergillus candidus]
MAFNKKYAGLPDLDLAPDIYETPDLTDDASTIQTQTIRTTSDDGVPSTNPDIDRQPVNADAARAHFLGATVDARDANFSDSIAAKRRAYRSKSRRRQRRTGPNGVEEVGDLSDSEDEGVERKLARLRREVEELKNEMAAQPDKEQTGQSETQEQQKPTDDGILELSRAVDSLYASARGTPQAGGGAAAALAQKLAGDSAPEPSAQTADGAANQGETAVSQAAVPGPEPASASVLAHAAAFDSRLALIEAAMGISSASNPFLPTDAEQQPALQPVLPTIEHLTSRLATLTTTLVGPSPVSALPTTSHGTASTIATTPHLESLSTRVRKLAADAETLATARKRALDTAKAAQNARIPLDPPTSNTILDPDTDPTSPNQAPASSSSSSTAEVLDPAAAQRDEQATKIQALYATLPTIQSLHPILPSVLERLRSLRALHAGAAHAAESLDALERRQAEMVGEIAQWREGLHVVEEKMGRGEEALKGNMEVVEPWVRELERRMQVLGVESE